MTATILGGLFHQYGGTLDTAHTTSPLRRRVSQLLGTKSLMGLREVMETLNGATAGSTATKTLSRIAHSSELGGVRAIETETIVNRATVAGDVTEINADLLSLSSKTYDPTPVANLDGNPLGTR